MAKVILFFNFNKNKLPILSNPFYKCLHIILSINPSEINGKKSKSISPLNEKSHILTSRFIDPYESLLHIFFIHHANILSSAYSLVIATQLLMTQPIIDLSVVLVIDYLIFKLTTILMIVVIEVIVIIILMIVSLILITIFSCLG